MYRNVIFGGVMRRRLRWLLYGGVGLAASLVLMAAPSQTTSVPTALELAQQTYYNGNYLDAAEQTLAIRTAHPGHLAARELRTSAMLFQIKRLVGEDTPDRKRALASCAECPALIEAFREDVDAGRSESRRRLAADAGDLEALFYLGKLNLNYVWLHLGPLNRRTGWSEYREARRSVERVLELEPQHVRARVAHAWVEYIVDTKVMFGLQWMLGGGNRKRALDSVRQATSSKGAFYDLVEARFAHWEMLAREKQFGQAVDVARNLLRDFPQNKELTKFVELHGAAK
jgi:hypothetical protein